MLAGCAQGGPVTSNSAPQLATAAETLHIVVPAGMQLGLHRTVQESQVAKYIPTGQSIANWSSMFAASMPARKRDVTLQQPVVQ